MSVRLWIKFRVFNQNRIEVLIIDPHLLDYGYHTTGIVYPDSGVPALELQSKPLGQVDQAFFFVTVLNSIG